MAQKTANQIALEDNVFLLIEGNLKRIFATPVGYTTFREVQNVVFNCSENDQEKANFFFELLINGKLTKELPAKQQTAAHALISEFMMPIRVAKDVHERGEFINFVTSDMIAQQDRCVFLNRLARVDGQEFLLMTDVQNTCHLIRHFIARLMEAQKNPAGEKNLAEISEDILSLKNYLEELSKSLK
ncbi:CT_584 family protein [Chlamydiifrater volucris]|uniref:CT_584 family protein n=1 Tax=Chlamydiifrater volucris TaxID=2681470 RepID=UPI001BCBAF96|nr:CT_584 family protein [Chlamydiifrater volucris]